MSNTSLLNDLFYEIWNEGYIYEVDENGRNMSYGEYIAIAEEFEKALIEEVTYYNDFEASAEALKGIMEETTDDVRIFFCTEEYDAFDYYVDEEKGKVEMYNVPETLKEHFDDLKEYFEDMLQEQLEEDDEEFDMEW